MPDLRCFDCGGTNHPADLLVTHSRYCPTNAPDVRVVKGEPNPGPSVAHAYRGFALELLHALEGAESGNRDGGPDV